MPKFQNEQKPVKDILNVFAGSWVSNCIRKKMKATYKYSYFPVVFDGYRYRGDEVYEKLIESTLIQPTFVTRLPAQLVPLAKACGDDPTKVDVFELEINGQEVAPGYSELNDPIEQRRRFVEQYERDKKEGDTMADKIDEDFLTALEYGMPPAGGMGIGIDRLVMMLTGSEAIRDVILFPQMRIRKG